ncbi:hypothetical protein evm_013112 [Chilo suppressalis]|nr:hypothetical protein evm_013112 [Chilo suppressalis]
MKKSKVWTYFKKEPNRALCNICKKYVKTSGNTTNLAAHLKLHTKNEGLLQSSFDSRVIQVTPSTSSDVSNQDDAGEGTSNEPEPPMPSNNDPGEGTSKSREEQKVDEDSTPKRIKPFKSIAQYSRGGSKYNRGTDDIAYFICVDNRPFNLLEEPEQVVVIVTDSGANMVKAIRDSYGATKNIPCFAHMINLVCEDALKRTKELSNEIEHELSNRSFKPPLNVFTKITRCAEVTLETEKDQQQKCEGLIEEHTTPQLQI